MFNFAFGTNFIPSHVKKEDLVENYLMSLVRYLDEEGVRHIIGSFLPEGVFNVLSAKYFIDYPRSLRSIFSLSIRYGLCHSGNFGELLAQYILLRTAAICIIPSLNDKVRKVVFEPIELKAFLLALAGDNKEVVKNFFKINALLADSKISFSYFEHFPKNPILKPFDLMARCLFKASAISFE